MSELALREFHPFRAAGREFVYLVPSAAVFELDDAASAVIARLRAGEEIGEELTDAVDELLKVKAVGVVGPPENQPRTPVPPNFPLTTMVLNVTNQCNLSCTYCYEYGEDKIVDTENRSGSATARRVTGASSRATSACCSTAVRTPRRRLR